MEYHVSLPFHLMQTWHKQGKGTRLLPKPSRTINQEGWAFTQSTFS